MESDTLTIIRLLEESLWRVETRFDTALMDETFAPDFFEFGRSGRIHSRSELLFEEGSCNDIDATIPLPEFRARYLADDVVQVTYVSEVRYNDRVERGNRSSIWSLVNGTWKLRFHQGTPIE